MKRHFIKVPGGLRPAYDEDEQWLARKKTGALLELDIREPRNAKLHRKWWSLCNYLADHSDRFPTAEHASKYALIRLGYCTWIESYKPEGVKMTVTYVPIADSISFASMDDDKFSEMYDKACDLLCEIIPHVTDKNVRQVLGEYAGIGALMEGVQ
jgi:hypothetical protein